MSIPTIPNSGKLNSVHGDPEGYVTKNGEWAAVPCGTNFVIVHKGKQVHTTNSFQTAKDYILNKQKQTPRKRKSSSSLEKHFSS
jgi:hypothetical protein